jgi:hypothetical protein
MWFCDDAGLHVAASALFGFLAAPARWQPMKTFHAAALVLLSGRSDKGGPKRPARDGNCRKPCAQPRQGKHSP